MTIVEYKIDINAPAATVYMILMDFAKYPEWNPMITSITGDSSVGSKLAVNVTLGDRAPTSFKPQVVHNEKDKEFRWVGTVIAGFFFKGEHYFKIQETSTGCTFIHGETFTGILEPFITKMYGTNTEKAFKAYNEALKTRAESHTK